MASKNIQGITIEIGGDPTDLQKALKAPEAELSSLQAELRKVNSSLKFDPTNIELLGLKSEIARKELEPLTEKVRVLKEALQQVTPEQVGEEQFRQMRFELAKAESQLKSVSQSADDADKKIEAISAESLKDVGDATEQAESQMMGLGGIVENVANMFGIKLPPQVTNIIKGFDDTADSAGGLSEKVSGLARGLGIELDPALVQSIGSMGGMMAAAVAAAAALSIVVKALADMSVGAAQAADDIETNATIMGITNEQFQEFSYMADLVDTSVDTIGNTMSKLTRSMSDAKNGTEKTQEAFKVLGVSWADSAGVLRDNEDVFIETIEALSGVANETERDALAMQLFGRSARDLNPLIKAGGDSMRQLADEAHRMGYIMSSQALAASTAFADSLDRFNRVTEGLKNTLGQILSPLLTKGLESIVEIIGRISAGLKKSGLVEFLSTTFSIIGDVISVLTSGLAPAISTIFGALQLVFTILNPILHTISLITTAISEIIKLLTGQTGIEEFAENIDNAFGKLLGDFGIVRSEAKKTTSTIKTEAAGAGGAISDSFSAAADSTEKSMKKVSDTVYDSFSDARKAADEFNKQFSAKAYQLVQDSEGRARAVSKSSYKMYSDLKEYIDKYYAGASETEKIGAARTIHNNKELLEQIKRDFYGIVPAVGPAIGTSIVEGMGQSIMAQRQQVINSVRTLTDDIKKEFERGLDINSPSGVTEDYGDDTVAGFVNSILRGRQAVKRATASMIDSVKGELGAVTAAINPTRQTSSASSAAGLSGTGTLNDYSTMNISVANIRELDELVDWWQNKRLRERAAGAGI